MGRIDNITDAEISTAAIKSKTKIEILYHLGIDARKLNGQTRKKFNARLRKLSIVFQA